jgi:hypothetical protein
MGAPQFDLHDGAATSGTEGDTMMVRFNMPASEAIKCARSLGCDVREENPGEVIVFRPDAVVTGKPFIKVKKSGRDIGGFVKFRSTSSERSSSAR